MPANERINWTMNHELVHIAAIDQAARQRPLLPRPLPGQGPRRSPSSPRRSSTPTSPRRAARRRAGTTRASRSSSRPGWRAASARPGRLRRDGVPLDGAGRQPLLRPARARVRGHQDRLPESRSNSYLYGTRFMTYLAYQYSPEKLMRWVSRGARQQGLLRVPVQAGLRQVADEAWQRLDRVGARSSSRRTSRRSAQYPTTPYRGPRAAGPGLGVAGLLRRRTAEALRRLQLPGRRRARRRHLARRTARSSGSATSRIRASTSSPRSPTTPTAGRSSTPPTTTRYRDLVSLDPRDRRARTLIKDARIGDLAFNRADRSLWGIRHLNGIATLVRIPHPYNDWKQVRLLALRRGDLRPRHLARRPAPLGLVAEIAGQHSLRVMTSSRCSRATRRRSRASTSARRSRRTSCSRRTAKYLYGSSYYTGVVEHLPLRPRDRKLEAVSNTETGFFRPLPLGGDALIVFRYTGEGFVPATHRGEAARGRERDHVPRRSRSSRSTRC